MRESVAFFPPCQFAVTLYTSALPQQLDVIENPSEEIDYEDEDDDEDGSGKAQNRPVITA
jgi:hypothetical protein